MNWVIDLFTNPYLITALSSWGVAQIVKVIIHAIVNKKFDNEYKALIGYNTYIDKLKGVSLC